MPAQYPSVNDTEFDLLKKLVTNTSLITGGGGGVTSVNTRTGAVTLTSADVSLSNVTDDAQTKAAVVPNTLPTSGQILIGNIGGTAYAPQSLSGDATLASTGAITLANTAVTPGSYTAANITVDSKGRITSAANGSGGGAGFETGSGLQSFQQKPVQLVGQVTLANGSDAILGVGTLFTTIAAMQFDGGGIVVKDSAGDVYYILQWTVVDDTHATIVAVKKGVSLATSTAVVFDGVSGTYDFYLTYSNAQGGLSLAAGLNSGATGNYSNAFGTYASASGEESFASGPYAAALGDYTNAVGTFARVTADEGQSFGAYTSVTAAGAAVFGYNFENNVAGTLALGLSAPWLRLNGSTAEIIGGALLTGNPSGGTAAAWKLGTYSSGIAQIDIAGTGYSLVTTGYTGGALGTKTIATFNPTQGDPPASNYATYNTRNNHPVLEFDTTTQEAIYFTGRVPQGTSFTGGLTVYVQWAAATATTGTIGWDVAFERIVAAGLDIDSDSFGTAKTITAATVSGTSGITSTTSVNFASGDLPASFAEGDMYRIRIRRDVANDTATGDAQLVQTEIRLQ